MFLDLQEMYPASEGSKTKTGHQDIKYIIVIVWITVNETLPVYLIFLKFYWLLGGCRLQTTFYILFFIFWFLVMKIFLFVVYNISTKTPYLYACIIFSSVHIYL